LRITIISPFSFGYIDSLVLKLLEYPGIELLYINTHEIQYQYLSVFQRLKNVWLKNFFGRNLKTEFTSNEIRKKLESQPKQDVILVIRPDKLETELLSMLKTKTPSLRTFYFDGTGSIPEQINLVPFFDIIYSYDKKDVEQYGFNYITNFIPFDVNMKKSGRGVFNISSYDKRYETLEKIALQLKEMNFPGKIIVRKEKALNSENINVVKNYISLEEVMNYMEGSSILLDIQKENQEGLSFRVFEALGYEKKLITTNKDIVNYDFYNPHNILVIDREKPYIPKNFLDSSYSTVPEEIRKKYRRESWIKQVFGISKLPVQNHPASVL